MPVCLEELWAVKVQSRLSSECVCGEAGLVLQQKRKPQGQKHWTLDGGGWAA